MSYRFYLIAPEPSGFQKYLARRCEGLLNPMCGGQVERCGRAVFAIETLGELDTKCFYAVYANASHQIIAFMKFQPAVHSRAFGKVWKLDEIGEQVWRSNRSLELVAMAINAGRRPMRLDEVSWKAEILSELTRDAAEHLKLLHINRYLVMCSAEQLDMFRGGSYPMKILDQTSTGGTLYQIGIRFGDQDGLEDEEAA